jgi:hypothetical protein
MTAGDNNRSAIKGMSHLVKVIKVIKVIKVLTLKW